MNSPKEHYCEKCLSNLDGRAVFQEKKPKSWRTLGIWCGALIVFIFIWWLIAAIGASGLSDT
jgi:hypothetical protein